MKPILKTLPRSPGIIPIRPQLDAKAAGSLTPLVFRVDELLLTILRSWSITVLRLALGFVFLWFGILKMFGTSPVILLIQQTFTFLPTDLFILVLGVWETLIGIGLIFKRALRCVVILLGIHLLGTFIALLLNPRDFFEGFPFVLTADGEFVMKNLVLMAATLVIAGYEVKPLTKR